MCLPAGQLLQKSAPSCELALPISHGSHAVPFDRSLYLPGLQKEHATIQMPLRLKPNSPAQDEPAVHGWQTSAPDADE